MAEILFQWQIPETQRHDRGNVWYILSGLITASLILISIWQKNILFGIIVVMLVVVYIFFHHDEERWIDFSIEDGGIVIDSRQYPYKYFAHFWTDKDHSNLYLQTKSWFRPALKIPLPPEADDAISAALEIHIKKSKDHTELGEPFSVTLSKIFKL